MEWLISDFISKKPKKTEKNRKTPKYPEKTHKYPEKTEKTKDFRKIINSHYGIFEKLTD